MRPGLRTPKKGERVEGKSEGMPRAMRCQSSAGRGVDETDGRKSREGVKKHSTCFMDKRKAR